MKMYTLREIRTLKLLPWSTRTIFRMRDRGDIKLINVGQGQRNRWVVDEGEIERIKKLYRDRRTNKMIDGGDLNTN
jgi:hypothetical protein